MPKILVIGEKFVDRYFIGTATRLSPEAPIPVVNVSEVIQFGGGAANVAANLKALGAETRELYQPGHYPIKNRLVSGTHQLARWDQDDTIDPFTPLQINLSKHLFKDLDGVIISDYNKGVFDPTSTAEIFRLIPPTTSIFVDTKASPTKFSMAQKRTFFFPNLKEYIAHTYTYTSFPQIIRKESEQGMTYVGHDYGTIHQPALATKVVSVSGAGDTAVAAFAYAYCRGKRISEALEFAARACAVVVGKPYTSTASQEEIAQYESL